MQATARHLRTAFGLAGLASLLLLSGCLGEPEIEDRWTRLDVVEVEDGAIDPETDDPALRIRGRITYRTILTGSLIMEIRSSDTFGAKDLDLREEADRLVATRQIVTLLESSGTQASATRVATGFDRLIQEVDFFFPGSLPTPGPGGSLYAVFYFGDVDEIDVPGEQEDIVVITARDFEAEHILPGAKLLASGPEGGTP